MGSAGPIMGTGQTLQLAPSVPVAGTPNALVGQAMEYAGDAIVMTLYANAAATGLTHALFGNRGKSSLMFVPPGAVIGLASTVGKIKTNEDFVGMWAVPAGTRLVHAITNTTAGAIVAQFLYIVT